MPVLLADEFQEWEVNRFAALADSIAREAASNSLMASDPMQRISTESS